MTRKGILAISLDGTKPTRLHFQNLIWRDLQTHSCNVQSVRPDPTRSPVQDISKQLVPKHKGLLDMGMCSEGTWQPPGFVAWDLQVPRPSEAEQAGLGKGSGMGAMEPLHSNGHVRNQPDSGEE